MPHEPEEHTWPPPHPIPQPPQLPLSVCVSTSHPLAAVPSQLAKPGLHAPMTHVPVEQVAPALGKLHWIPHPPQLFTSLPCVAVSQPLLAMPSQLPYPLAQETTAQALDEHASTETFGRAQTLAQLPQWFTSVLSLTQLPAQLVSPPPHVVVQAPEEHTWPPPHPIPQPPQLPLSDCVLTSQPLAALPSQSAKPVAQVPREHVPLAQVAPALG